MNFYQQRIHDAPARSANGHRWQRREMLFVLLIALVTIVLWRQPVVGMILYPFRLFNTFVHELSHGLAAMVTGGAFRRFVVNPDLSGIAWSAGGIRWIVASAGYIGSALFGGMLTVLSSRRIAARQLLFGLGLVLGILCLLFVRNLFGVVSGLLLAVALCFAGRRLQPLWADRLLLLLAVQMMLNGFDSLLDLLLLSSATSRVTTDAHIMADSTGVPALIWAALWLVVAVAILYSSLRFAYLRPPAQEE